MSTTNVAKKKKPAEPTCPDCGNVLAKGLERDMGICEPCEDRRVGAPLVEVLRAHRLSPITIGYVAKTDKLAGTWEAACACGAKFSDPAYDNVCAAHERHAASVLSGTRGA